MKFRGDIMTLGRYLMGEWLDGCGRKAEDGSSLRSAYVHEDAHKMPSPSLPGDAIFRGVPTGPRESD